MNAGIEEGAPRLRGDGCEAASGVATQGNGVEWAMPANRHRRRAAGARARRGHPAGRRPITPLARMAFTGAGLGLIALALLLLLGTQHGRVPRGSLFAAVFGLALIGMGVLPGRRP
jgi:hypothetical protein